MPNRSYTPIVKSDETGLYETIINGRKYEFTKWGADISTATLLQLGGLLGDSLELLASAIGISGKPVAEKDVIGKLVASIFFKAAKDSDMTMRLLKRFATHEVFCDGKQLCPDNDPAKKSASVPYDRHFEDCLEEVRPVVTAAFEVQYRRFFAAIGAQLVDVPPAETQKTPTT